MTIVVFWDLTPCTVGSSYQVLIKNIDSITILSLIFYPNARIHMNIFIVY
jgi:hypothetical protein